MPHQASAGENPLLLSSPAIVVGTNTASNACLVFVCCKTQTQKQKQIGNSLLVKTLLLLLSSSPAIAVGTRPASNALGKTICLLLDTQMMTRYALPQK